MQKSIRQSMASLHSWTGLLFGWLLFAIFLMGSVSYYRHEISLWMQPQFASMQVNQTQAIESAYTYLQNQAPDAKSWYIGIANEKQPVNQIFIEKADGTFEKKILDATAGKELTLSATQGGDFFYNFHFQLYGIPFMIGRMVVTLAAFIMLIALVSGMITHKKILTDFFTFRAFKGQRSYLDFHNVSSVIALPFFLSITFTGIAIFFYIYLPWGMKQLYPDQPYQYFQDIRSVATLSNQTPHQASMKPIQYFRARTEALWGTTQLNTITVKQPNTTQSVMTITELKDHSITLNHPQISFNTYTGRVLANTRNDSVIATLSYGVYGLHMGTFAQPILRILFFLSGILGSLMIASGLLLWSLKRQIQNKKQRFHFGYYLVNRLNIATFIGLTIAMLSYLYANRLVQVQSGAINYEIYSFFTVWSLSLIVALCTKQKHLWKSQLKIFILAALCLPILDVLMLIRNGQMTTWQQYWMFARIDLMILLFAFTALFLHQQLVPIQSKATQKINRRLQNNLLQGNS